MLRQANQVSKMAKFQFRRLFLKCKIYIFSYINYFGKNKLFESDFEIIIINCLETYFTDMVIFNENIGVEILHNVGVFPVEYCVCSYVGLVYQASLGCPAI